MREGWQINRKRVYRVYRELGLAVRRKKRKKVAQANRRPRVVPIALNIQWSLDFMRDTLASGRVVRTLNVVDDASWECLAIEVDTSLSGHRVGRVLDAVAQRRGGYPDRLVLDNGPECTSKALAQWAYERGVPRSSSARTSRSRTASSRASTASFATSASICTGS